MASREPNLFDPPPRSLLEILDKADRDFDVELTTIFRAIANKRPGQKAYPSRASRNRSVVMIFGGGTPQFITCRWGFHWDRANVHADAFNRKVPTATNTPSGAASASRGGA